MIELITNNRRENIILFVHGFTGGKETWKHPKSGYFFDRLQQFDLIYADGRSVDITPSCRASHVGAK